MKYADIRPLLKSGDIVAFSHVGWGSWHDIKVQLVRIFTRSEYSHVATVWVVGNRVFVIEAVIPEVRIFPLSKLGDFYWLKTNVPWKDDTEEYALSRVGELYSQWEAIEAAVGEPKKDALWECAELVRSIAEKDGLIIPTRATPSELVRGLGILDINQILVTNP